jgi:hypothetical protein
MKKYNTATQEVLLRIMELSEDTAPVIVSFGYTKGGMCESGLVIKSAPSAVIKAIVNDERVTFAHLEDDGLHIEASASINERSVAP